MRGRGSGSVDVQDIEIVVDHEAGRNQFEIAVPAESVARTLAEILGGLR